MVKMFLVGICCLMNIPGIYAQADGMMDELIADNATVIDEMGSDEISVKLGADNRMINDRFAIALQIGTDIGGAIPMPLRYVPKRFAPYPRMSPSIGMKAIFPIYKEWSIGVETTYKKVMMDADARVQDQRFKQYAQLPGEQDIIAAFTGTAEMNMDFTMLEIPVYANYTFRNFKDRIVFGPYFAWMIGNKFEILAQKGYITDEEGKFTDEIKQEDPLHIDFSRSLSSFDVGVMVGYERAITGRIDVGARVMVGLKDIFRADERYLDYSMTHMRASVVVSYAFVNVRSKKNILGYELKELNQRNN
ncbi:MAG: outer membrane beta-barrel protein [Marinifilaceae bacterium]